MSDLKERFAQAKEQAKKASCVIGEKVSQAGKIAAESAKTIAVTILDHDGDGRVDQNDVKIMTEKGVVLAKKAADEAKVMAKEVAKTDLGKDALTGAAIGAGVAIPVPVIGPVAGAAIGAGIGVYSNLTKKSVSVVCKDYTSAEKESVSTTKKGTVTKKKSTTTKAKSTTKKPKS